MARVARTSASIRTIVALFAVFGSVSLVAAQSEDCSRWDLQTCNACLRQTTTCGWCESWSSCVPLTEATFCGYGWKYPTGTTAVTGGTNDTQFGLPVLPLFDPKAATMNLRKGIPRTVVVNVSPRLVVDVDVYFLVDRTAAMTNQLFTLRSLAGAIATAVFNSSATNGTVQIGLGSFVEKPIAPFADPSYEWPNGDSAQKTYMFQNDVPLTSDKTAWATALGAMRPIGDYDVPHAGLDAMLQVVQCDTAIQWRSNSRRVLFVLTNAGYHVAMDGLRAGIEAPANDKCALSGNVANIVDRDYPSVEMLSSFYRQSAIVPVFGFARSSANLNWAYGEATGLSGRIGRGFSMGLNDDFSDIVTEVDFALKRIANTVQLYPDPKQTTTVSVTSINPRVASLLDATGTKRTSTVAVAVTLVAPAHVMVTDPVSLVMAGHPGTFTITVTKGYTYSCESCSGLSCPKDCNGRGTCDCGRCTNCIAGYDGTECQYTASSSCSTGASVPCSGHGTCEGYGRCKCDDGWTFQINEGRVMTQFCDCPTSPCMADANGNQCSGNGLCVCGKCRCYAGFDGADCGCETFKQCDVDCNAAYGGRAECVCGKCQCKAPWFGEGCARCDPTDPSCPYGKSTCESFQTDCASCVAFLNGTACHWCSDVQACLPNSIVATCRAPITLATQTACRCAQGCPHDVYFQYTAGTMVGQTAYADVSKDKTKPGPAIGISFACCIGAGIIIVLLWRVFVYYLDKEEWERFEFKCLEVGVNAALAKDWEAKKRSEEAAAAAQFTTTYYAAKKTEGVRVPVIEAAERKRKQDEEDAKKNAKNRKKEEEKRQKAQGKKRAEEETAAGRTTAMEMNPLRQQQQDEMAAAADIMFANDNLFTMCAALDVPGVRH